MSVYLDTFTLVAGGITITFNARPSNINYNKKAHISEHDVGGATGQTIIQNLGYGGYRISFNCTIWNITSIAMTGAGTLGDQVDIVGQIEDWWTNGTVITFLSDYINERTGGSITVKIVGNLSIIENPGHARDYNLEMTLQQYDAGSAI